MAKILIVDDNMQVRELLELLLEDAGHTVFQCEDGLTAINLVETDHPDVVLMDLNMPGMDGFSALEAIRSSSARSDTPVIMVTASGHPQLMHKARKLGATDFIVKPWKDFEVEDRISLALA